MGDPTFERRSIPGNRWDLLRPDPSSSWTPNRRVSICIPARSTIAKVSRTLSALAVQTYPAALIEVIVADDSSAPPLELSDIDVPFAVRVVRQDVGRFAAGRARGLAASAASGEVLVFLDADVIPSRGVLESYLRWFERCDAVVPFGFLNFVELSSLSAAALGRALKDHDMAVFEGLRRVDDQHWRERTFSATDDMQQESGDMFRTLVGASLAVSAEQYDAVGGFADLGVRGVEDIEFGYRLQNNGALFIPERSALHWHDGGRTMSSDRIAPIRRKRAPYTDALLPVGDFRGDKPAPHSPVPVVARLLVHVDPSMADAQRLAARIRAADGPDVEVRVGTCDDRFTAAFAQVSVTEPVEWRPGATRSITEQLMRQNVGTLLIVGAPGAPVLEVVRTRAIRAARPVDGSNGITRMLFAVGVANAPSVRLTSTTSRVAARFESSRRRLVAIAVRMSRRIRPPRRSSATAPERRTS